MEPQQTVEIDQLLLQARTIAIVGLSNKSERDSYKVAMYLIEHGYQVFGVNPMLAGTEILGQQCYASLKEAVDATGLTIDIVDCFRKTEEIPAIVEAAGSVGAGAIWMQLDILNEDAAKRARDIGMRVVMDRCTKIEHKRLHGIS